jgi:translation initiation factor 3 subunit M
MAATDSVSVFAEGTFEEQVNHISRLNEIVLSTSLPQIQELVNYIVRNRSEEERAAFIRPFQDALKTEDGQKPLEKDEERRRKILSMVLSQVKVLGEGTDKGMLGANS